MMYVCGKFLDLSTVVLITPPFTQLNTPYPATAYLKGFLNTRGVSSFQADLGIEVTNLVFSSEGLKDVFNRIGGLEAEWSDNCKRIIALQDQYVQTIDIVMSFLQGKRPTMAQQICQRNFLPEADRFKQIADITWAFGAMGIQDQAKHLATMYLEDLSDLIKETLDDHFGFSRYAERLGRAASEYDELYEALNQPLTFIDEKTIQVFKAIIEKEQPKLVAISVPFPGNLYAGLRCAQWLKTHHPSIKVALGGGYANTELRSLSDTRVFEVLDFITLDDGEAPIEQLIKFVEGTIQQDQLKRCLLNDGEKVSYINNAACTDYKQGQVGTPDYSDFKLDQYISALEVANPMHRLWSDGRWNKLTMAHGCYWAKCTFCDINLDYIQRYEPINASILCDRMEEMMAQTGENGFHFVDEAAPPSLMKALALEIIKRKLVVSWWTNIRFEKNFTRDLCLLLKESGCIAVSGGLEVASDRLLALIQKGITVEQVAQVTKHFTEAGIMVHAYLMYGFPTQTAQETIDSLEMVRQLFKTGVLQSAFWHLFTMTAHSPVGKNPAAFKVERIGTGEGRFANNDRDHHDPVGEHERFGDGLRKALFNYMHALGFEEPLHKWFDFKVPKTTVAPDLILNYITNEPLPPFKLESQVIWLNKSVSIDFFTQTKKGNSREMANITLITRKQTYTLTVPAEQGKWLFELLPTLGPEKAKQSLKQVQDSYEKNGWDDFELFWDNKPMSGLHKFGLLRI